jgi:hypothetical protein
MNRLAALLTLSTVLAATWPVPAEEPPHLEFVRGLRARGMADLALQYLQSKSQNPPADLAVVLPLEMAKARLDLAATRPDPAGRLAEQNLARAELEQFVKSNPKHPLAAEASLQIARIAALQGKAQLSRARRQEAKNLQQAECARARALFEQAAQQLQASTSQIDAQLANYGNPANSQAETEKQTLTQARLQAELDQGINLLEQAQCYVDASEVAKRSELLKKAMDVLDKLSKRDTQSPVCWQALVWLGRCHQENEDPKSARKLYMDVIGETGEQAEAARRVARYFRMQTLAADATDPKKALADERKAGEEWLQFYPNYLNTPEGCGVRFELARTYVKLALAAPKLSAQARGFFEQARKLYQSLELTENDYTTRAHENKLQIIFQVSYERARDDISKLHDFEECYLRAQFEVASLHEDSKKIKGPKLEEKRKEHFQRIVEALTRGLDLASSSSPAEEINDARYLLAYAYLTTEDFYRAAVAGEDLARTDPRALQAPMAGAYALQAYAALLGKQEEAGVTAEDQEALRGRLRRLAQYIEQTWPSDSAADIARHMLGWLLLAEKNYVEAVTVMERVSPAYADSTRLLYQLADAALKAAKDETIKPQPGKPSFQDRAEAALLKIPDLTSAADSGTVQAYVGAKSLLAGIYYRTKRFDKMEALAESLVKHLDGLESGARAEHATTAYTLTLFARLRRAETEYHAGHYTRAREILDPVVKEFNDPAKKEEFDKIKDKEPGLLRAMLGLALRANVQDNRVERGRELLEQLQKTFLDNAQQILIQFVQQLREQVQQLRSQGESAQQQLEKMVGNFSQFLEVLAKQQEKNPKPEVLLFLAQSYSSLENHARAAELASQIPEPRPDEGKKEADPKQVALCRFARILFARELRLNKELDKAELVLKEIRGTKWGEHNIDVQKEGIQILEDQEKYVLPGKQQGAVFEWSRLMQSLRPRMNDNKVKEHYFDCYYHLAYCYYKYALKLPDPKKRQRNLRVAANYIYQLEKHQDAAADPCRKRFEELLEKEPPLKEQYEQLKKDSN